MDIRTVTALILLYRACPDPVLKRKVEAWLPGIDECSLEIGLEVFTKPYKAPTWITGEQPTTIKTR